MNNFIIAQIFGVCGIISSVLSMQMEKRKNIIIMLILLNLSSALNFLFLGSYTGSFISFFAILETFINYLFERKGKNVPIYVIMLYVIINIILGSLSFQTIMDILPIICSIIFCLTIYSKKESNIRKLMFINQVFWLVYDIYTKAYMFSICNILTMISVLIAIFRYDKKH